MSKQSLLSIALYSAPGLSLAPALPGWANEAMDDSMPDTASDLETMPESTPETVSDPDSILDSGRK